MDLQVYQENHAKESSSSLLQFGSSESCSVSKSSTGSLLKNILPTSSYSSSILSKSSTGAFTLRIARTSSYGNVSGSTSFRTARDVSGNSSVG
ncbi:hypothetical protein Hanom_Chr09g00809551 [Helianthus anomalus]